MRNSSFGKIAGIVVVFCVATVTASQAQTYNVLFKLNGTDGYGWAGTSAVQGRDGNVYGTTAAGGNGYSNTYGGGDGTVFRITPSGKFTSFYKFCSLSNCADGIGPRSLALGLNGNFYGATQSGGTGTGIINGCGATTGCGGTFFEMTSSGTLKTLYSFCSQANCADGSNPTGVEGPVLGTNGRYYGTTYQGGNSACFDGCGTVYDITTSGALSTLYELCTQVSCPLGDGGAVGLLLGNNGKFYGLQLNDGEPPIPGLIFSLTPQGKDQTIYTFQQGSDGYQPILLIQGSDGNFYGLASQGANVAGTLFKVTPSGEFTTLHSFCSQTNCADGEQPNSLLEGSDGNFYGVTTEGGANSNSACGVSGCGVMFKVTSSGEYSVIYNFCSQANCADGAAPSGMMQATNGTFYGGTTFGGTSGTCYLNRGCGVIFSFSTGLSPFVEANPGFGAVGHVVNILGNNLAGATSVTFNGTPAKFKVVANTYIEAQLPSGATSGTIQVTTSSGTLNSNVIFRVVR